MPTKLAYRASKTPGGTPMHPATILSVITGASLLTLMACQPPPEAKPAKSAQKSSTQGGERKQPPQDPIDIIDKIEKAEFLKPGSAPRVVRRHRSVAVGTTHTVEIQTAIGMIIAGREFPLRPLPRLRFTTDVSTANGLQPETLIVSYHVTSAEPVNIENYDAEIARVVSAQANELRDLKATLTVTSRGEILKSQLQPGRPISAPTRQVFDVLQRALHESIIVFPEEAIGVNGQWRVSRRVSMGGLSVLQTTEYTLKAAKKDSLDLVIHYRHTAKPQPMPLVDTPKGSSAKLEKLTGEGDATQQLDLASWRTTLASRALIELDYTYRDKEADHAVGMRMNIEQSMRPNDR